MSEKIIEYLATARLQEQQLSLYEDNNQYWEVDKYFNNILNTMCSELSEDDKRIISEVVNRVAFIHIPELPPNKL